jgi:signal transduction histidine kinase
VANPFAVPEVAPLALRPFSQKQPSLHRQRLAGTVTLARRGEFFYVQTPLRAVRVNTRGSEVLTPGDEVEASGFVAATQGFAVLDEALVRRTGHGPVPAPIAITRAQVLAVKSPDTKTLRQEDYDGTLVTLRGRLVKIESNAGEEHRLFLDCAGGVVIATLGTQVSPAALAHFSVGSEVEATGICAVRLSARWPALVIPVPEDFALLLHAPESLRVLRAPSWWTPQRLWTALGLTGGVLLLSLAWIWTLRRRVARRSAALADEMRARRDAAVEFETTLRERTRLAADLHDTLEQSLTGLALQLEAAADLQTEAPARSGQHLALARQLLDRSREDVRRSVWELRTNPLEGNTLTEALRCIAADRSAGLDVRIAVESEGEPQPLPDFVAGNLLLLAQEGITNALKHAAPQHITLRLTFTKNEVTLRIRDDGRGFIPASALGPREGHFGLQGMRERAKRLGGTLTIESAPGAGTHVSVSVPVAPHAAKIGSV